MMYLKEREELCEVVRMMFDRHLTNAAGGNITAKVSDEHYIMTPTLMSQQKFCRLTPNDILVIDKDCNIIDGEGKLTREVNMHMGVYNVHPKATAVIHAHPNQLMIYASMGLDLPHMCENTRKLGEVKCLEFAPACSEELAIKVSDYVKTRKDEKNPLAMLLREHGVLVVDFNLKACYDMLERLESNAYVNTMSRLIQLSGEKYKEQDFDYNTEE